MVSTKMNGLLCRPVSLFSLMEMDSTGLSTEPFPKLRHKYTHFTSFFSLSLSLSFLVQKQTHNKTKFTIGDL